jgi:cytochrome P450
MCISLVATFQRIVKKPIELSNGMILSAGTFVVVPLVPYLLDEECWDSPQSFDGFRFSKIRACLPEKEGEQWEYGHSSMKMMTFGLGRHVCPAAFLASQLIKMNLAHIMLNYEVELLEDRNEETRNTSYFRTHDGTSVLFRKRRA